MTGTTPRHGFIHPSSNEKVKDLGAIAEQFANQVDFKMDVRRNIDTTFKRGYNLAMFEEQNSNLTGWIVIQTNLDQGVNSMHRIDITGYVYAPNNNIIDLSVTFYTYESLGIINAEAHSRGSMDFTEIQILARTSDGKIAIALKPETPSNYWQFPKLVVDGMFGHIETLDTNIRTGWSITRQTSLAAYTSRRTLSTGWNAMVLQNGFANLNATTFDAAGYKKKNGIVFLRGMLHLGTRTAGTVIANLPEGFRIAPGGYTHTAVTAGAMPSGGSPRVNFEADGDIVVNALAATDWLSFSFISYPADG